MPARRLPARSRPRMNHGQPAAHALGMAGAPQTEWRLNGENGGEGGRRCVVRRGLLLSDKIINIS